VESSEDNGSEDKIGTRKFGKGPLGKGKGWPPKKKAKATKKILLRGSVESSEDDGSEDKIGARKFGKGLLGKGKESPPKKKEAKATKNTRDEDSDNNNNSSYYDEKEPTPIYDTNRRELITMIEEQKKMKRDLKMKLENQTEMGRRSLKNVRLDHNWNAEETIFADVVGHYCKHFLFPWYKFLKIGWEQYRPDVQTSLSPLTEQSLKDKQPQSNKKDMWERVSAVTIQLKYNNMKCNLNNLIKTAYKSKCYIPTTWLFADVISPTFLFDCR
jgi:hypothetical protein